MKLFRPHLLLTLASILILGFTVGCGDDDAPILVEVDPEPQPLYVPRWEATACRHNPPAGSTTHCGFLIVPMRRDDPTGPTVRVYHTIFPALDGSTGNLPVVYWTGGPGAETLGAINLFEAADDPALGIYRKAFGSNRDLIVVDQRGGNQSSPTIYCSQELGPERDAVYGMTFRDAADLRVQRMIACRERLTGQGIDLSGFNTYEIALDLVDYMQVMGLPKINIYGASYGTRLTMQAMRLFPDLINAVILDSVLPPELNPFIMEVQGTQHGIDRLVEASRDDFPMIQTYIETILNRLEANPVTVTAHHYDSMGNPTDNHDVLVTGVKFIDYLANQLRETPYNRNLPKNLEDMFNTENYQMIADSWLGTVDFSFPVGGAAESAAVVGMFQSVFAANDAFYATPQDVFDNIGANVSSPGFADWLANTFVWQEPCMLDSWNVEPLPVSATTPVESDIPTLMFVGDLDVATPEIFSRPSEPFLSNHVYHVIRAGHATAFLPCVLDMIEAWLNDPGVPPTNGCATEYMWNR